MLESGCTLGAMFCDEYSMSEPSIVKKSTTSGDPIEVVAKGKVVIARQHATAANSEKFEKHPQVRVKQRRSGFAQIHPM